MDEYIQSQKSIFKRTHSKSPDLSANPFQRTREELQLKEEQERKLLIAEQIKEQQE